MEVDRIKLIKSKNSVEIADSIIKNKDFLYILLKPFFNKIMKKLKYKDITTGLVFYRNGDLLEITRDWEKLQPRYGNRAVSMVYVDNRKLSAR